MVQIKTLRNKKTGKKYSPRTHVKAVYDDNNNTLDSLLGVQDEKLSELGSKVNFCLFVDSYQSLVSPTEETNYKQGCLLNKDGSEKDLPSEPTAWLYTITNVNTKNQIKYVSHDFGSQEYLRYDNHLNCALYDINGVFVKGCIANGKKIIQIPANYTLKVSVRRTYNTSIVESSTEVKDERVTIQKVQTWGDSITAAGKYQSGIAAELNISTNNIKNAGIASDFSMHVRNRFVSYFTEDVPYIGAGTYSVPTLAERQAELNNSFFVFWIGTNNLINPNRTGGSFTTGNESFTALQPNPNFKFDRLYSRAYKDMILNDIKQIIQILPHKNFAIIGGHGGFSSSTDMYKKMLEVDELLARMYPRNYIDVRELVCMDYDYQGTQLSEAFIKPALNGSVVIKLTDASWIGNDENSSYDICVGTKSIYDKYHVASVSGNSVTATLVESNTEFVEGDTISKEYLLVSDLGRDVVNMPTSVFSYEDCVHFSLMSFPRSSSDPIHFTNEQYIRIGQLIGKEILKII